MTDREVDGEVEPVVDPDNPFARAAALLGAIVAPPEEEPPATVTPPLWSRAYATNCPRDSVTCTRLRCARPVGTKAR